MNLISNMDEPMDEVLLSSAVEACVRIRKPELLSIKLEQLKISPAAATQGHAGGRVARVAVPEVPRRLLRGAEHRTDHEPHLQQGRTHGRSAALLRCRGFARIRKPELLSIKLEQLKFLPEAVTQGRAGGRVARVAVPKVPRRLLRGAEHRTDHGPHPQHGRVHGRSAALVRCRGLCPHPHAGAPLHQAGAAEDLAGGRGVGSCLRVCARGRGAEGEAHKLAAEAFWANCKFVLEAVKHYGKRSSSGGELPSAWTAST